MLPCSISLLQPDLTPPVGQRASKFQLGTELEQGLGRLGGTRSGAAELCLYSRSVNTLAEISGDLKKKKNFFLYSAEKIVEG